MVFLTTETQVSNFRSPVNVRSNPQTEPPGGKASRAADHSWRLPEDSLEYILSTLEIFLTNPLTLMRPNDNIPTIIRKVEVSSNMK
uniref:Uncharacterized protein n=1 Tax=Candidatus Kentrum sp. SD TaxID=2126332 RepID=A0A451BSV6_9GAMM|nr:MAG: hypothetical protein BECKSD772D_GA0070982_13391 [Candidatus Kentron sp. SD]